MVKKKIKLQELIWAKGNKCSILHVLPEEAFVPSICGFESKANRGGTAKWVIYKASIVEKIINKEDGWNHHNSFCEKCLKLVNKEQ